jgi:hypothetical protein
VYDVSGKPWSWDNGQSCAVRHAQQPDLQGKTTGDSVQWDSAPTCGSGVQPATYDDSGKPTRHKACWTGSKSCILQSLTTCPVQALHGHDARAWVTSDMACSVCRIL